jgi:hypothetical protein
MKVLVDTNILISFIVPTVPVGMPLTTLCVACERTRSVPGGIPTQSVGTMTLANLGYLG